MGKERKRSTKRGRDFAEAQHIRTPSETEEPRPAITDIMSLAGVRQPSARPRDRSEHLGFRVANQSTMGKGDSSPELWLIKGERAVPHDGLLRPEDSKVVTGWMTVGRPDSRQ